MAERLVGRPVRGPSHRRVFVLVTALLLALATPAYAQGGATYAVRPAPGDGDRSSGGFDLSVGTGSAVSDAVQIFNFTNDPATFDVYAADVVPTTGGSLAPAAREARITGPAAWITVDQATVEVPPRSSTIVPFTINVPVGTPLGNHTAALLVETQGSSDTGTIGSRTRVGLWVRVKVTEFESEVLGEESEGLGDAFTRWVFSWILVILVGLAFLAWLMYVTRHRRHRWVQHRREERALLRDFRSRRRHDEATSDHR